MTKHGPFQLRRVGSPLTLLFLALLTGCAQSLGTTAGSFMRRARTSADPNLRYAAYGKLADPLCYTSDDQRREAVGFLSGRLLDDKEPVAARAQICRTLGALADPAAQEALRKAAEDESPLVRQEAARALGKVGTSQDAALLSRLMSADATPECRLAAIEGLGSLQSSDPRVIEQLLEGMKHDDPAIRLASYRSVQDLTGKDLGADPKLWAGELASRKAIAAQVAAQPSSTPTRR